MSMFPELGAWLPVAPNDERAIALYRRHYSVTLSKNHHLGIAGPGESMVLLTPECDALFGWRDRTVDVQGQKDDGQRGFMCFVFRNESAHLSSALIREAVELARARWGTQRFFTYVDAAKTRHKRDPGHCFRKAGWAEVGKSKGGLVILAVEDNLQ